MDSNANENRITVNLLNNGDLKVVSVVLAGSLPITLHDLKEVLTKYAESIPVDVKGVLQDQSESEQLEFDFSKPTAGESVSEISEASVLDGNTAQE